jgi:hypothetical protein
MLAVLVAVAPLVAGCETLERLNPFGERETPLPGERREVFPGGVPGVARGIPETHTGQPPPPVATTPPPAPQPARTARPPRS